MTVNTVTTLRDSALLRVADIPVSSRHLHPGTQLAWNQLPTVVYTSASYVLHSVVVSWAFGPCTRRKYRDDDLHFNPAMSSVVIGECKARPRPAFFKPTGDDLFKAHAG